MRLTGGTWEPAVVMLTEKPQWYCASGFALTVSNGDLKLVVREPITQELARLS